MSTDPNVFALNTTPGVRRDGTILDSSYYNDAYWVRFQRGRPRKMGGYRLMSDAILGPSRTVAVETAAGLNVAVNCHPGGIELLRFDSDGIPGGIVDKGPSTASGFVRNENYTWQTATMFDSSGGGSSVFLAAATPDVNNISSTDQGAVYYGSLADAVPLVAVEDGSGVIPISGGCCVLQPFLFVYGNNGLIKNSNPNDFSVATGWSGGAGLANEANVAGSKILRGLPIRGGAQSPSGIFWSLESLIRVSFVGGTDIWRYDTISSAISVLSKAGIIELDGIYYWPGVDRFLMYNGVVQELPNDMNLNFFYDNINQANRNKCWAKKVPKFGEIWWYFPFGESTECNHAIVYNVREKTWYDTPIERSAGASPQIFKSPVLARGDGLAVVQLVTSALVGDPIAGVEVVGGTSGAVGVIRKYVPAGVVDFGIYVEMISGTFVGGEGISGNGITATLAAGPFADRALDELWLHEEGVDRIFKQDVTAIPAGFETDRFNWMTGGPAGEATGGHNLQTRVVRVEPDFVMSGTMSLKVKGTSYAQSGEVTSEPFPFTSTTEFTDPREQRRECSLVFESNEIGGNFQMGQVFVTVEPGDVRG
jgi:hypothetical protein